MRHTWAKQLNALSTKHLWSTFYFGYRIKCSLKRTHFFHMRLILLDQFMATRASLSWMDQRRCQCESHQWSRRWRLGGGGKGKTQMLADVYYIQKYLCAHIAHRPFDCVGGTSKLIYNNFMICASIVIAWWMCSQYIRLTAIYVAIRALCWCLVLFGLFTFQLIVKSWCDKMNEIAS